MAASEPFYPGDLAVALEGYSGTHSLVTVLTDISLYEKETYDKPLVSDHIAKEKKAAQQDNKFHKILAPINNGTFHFVFLDVTIQPSGKVETCLRDSKKENEVSPDHKEKNNTIVVNIQEIAGTPFQSKVEYTGEDKTLESTLLKKMGEFKSFSPSSPRGAHSYSRDFNMSEGSSQQTRGKRTSPIVCTGEQGENANCPFYSVREVVRVFSRPPFDHELKLRDGDSLAEAAASNDIVKMQLAMVKKVAAKRKGKDDKAVNFDISTLEIDELGILHTVPLTAAYLKHKKIRAVNHFKEKIKIFYKEITEHLENKNERDAGKALVRVLSVNADNLFQEEDKTANISVQQERDQFRFLAQTNCTNAIETAKDQLNNLNSLGWKLLANILLGVVGAMTLGAAPGIHYCVTGRSWFLRPQRV